MYGNYPEIHNNDNKYSKHVIEGPGWLNESCIWITQQFIQAYHQYVVGWHPGL